MSQAQIVRVLVIGGGFGARVVAPIFAATDGCAVVDVVSPRDDIAVRRAIGRDDVDLVSVQSPPFLHARHVRLAIDAGKAVLCDKPFATDAREAAALLEDAEQAGVLHLVNFEFRHEPARQVLRAETRNDLVGPVEHVQWTHVGSGWRVPLRPYGWLFDATRGGGWIGAWASHAVDSLAYFFGPVERVAAAVRRIDVAERPDGDGTLHACTAEDAFQATLVLHGGVTVSIDTAWAASANFTPRLVAFGERGAIEIIGDERVTLVRGDGGRETLREPVRRGGDGHDVAMRAWAEVVRDTVRAGVAGPGVPTFADGHACDLVLDGLRSARLLSARGGGL